MEPLFKDEAEYDSFLKDHSVHSVKKADLKSYEGKCFLGIDAGSTTTKLALSVRTALFCTLFMTITTAVP